MTSMTSRYFIRLLLAGFAVGIAVAYWIYTAVLPKRKRQFLQQLRPFWKISRLFDQGNAEAAWDAASIDIQLDKLVKGRRYKTRQDAIRHIRAYLGQQNARLTKEQATRLCNLLSDQKHDRVRYEATRLLCDNAESLLQDDVEYEQGPSLADFQDRLGRWLPALLIWASEILTFVLTWRLLDQLEIHTLVLIAVVAVLVGILPSLTLAASWVSFLISVSIVVAVVSGSFWYVADRKHTQLERVSARPFIDEGIEELQMSITYPKWLTTDQIDSDDTKGRQIVVEVDEADQAEFFLDYDCTVVHIRDDDDTFDPFPITVEGSGLQRFELYLQAADRNAFGVSATTITPTLQLAGRAERLQAEELKLEVEMEDPIWREFRDICRLITEGSGGGGGALAAIWFLVPKRIRKRIRRP